jgi:hypothetical protein
MFLIRAAVFPLSSMDIRDEVEPIRLSAALMISVWLEYRWIMLRLVIWESCAPGRGFHSDILANWSGAQHDGRVAPPAGQRLLA